MSNHFLRYFFYFLISLNSSALFAAPLVSVPGGNIACSVDVTIPGYVNPDVAAPPNPNLSSLYNKADITRFNNIMHVQITWLDGHVSHAWIPGVLKLTLFQDPAKKEISSTRDNDLLASIFRWDADNTWYTWVTQESFVDVAVYKGIRCNHYQKSMTFLSEFEDVAPVTYVYQLWVDATSRAPIAFDDGQARYDITYKESPAAPLAVPPEIQKEIARYQTLLAPAKRR